MVQLGTQELVSDLPYSKTDRELTDFVGWLEAYMDSGTSQQFAVDFLASKES